MELANRAEIFLRLQYQSLTHGKWNMCTGFSLARLVLKPNSLLTFVSGNVAETTR